MLPTGVGLWGDKNIITDIHMIKNWELKDKYSASYCIRLGLYEKDAAKIRKEKRNTGHFVNVAGDAGVV